MSEEFDKYSKEFDPSRPYAWDGMHIYDMHSTEWFLSLYYHIKRLEEMGDEKMYKYWKDFWDEAHYSEKALRMLNYVPKNQRTVRKIPLNKNRIKGYSSSGCLISIIFPMLIILMILMVG